MLWILVMDGDNLVFEGNTNHWRDCFFSCASQGMFGNIDVSDVVDFCLEKGWKVTFSKRG